MRISYEKILLNKKESFKVSKVVGFSNLYHHHPEYEIVWIVKGKGKRFIANEWSEYSSDDLALLPPMLPHVWYEESNKNYSEAIVIQFSEKVFELLAQFKEIALLKLFLNHSEYGYVFEDSSNVIKPQMSSILKAKGLNKLLQFIQLLNDLASQDKSTILQHSVLVSKYKGLQPKIEKAINYILKNYQHSFSQSDLARKLKMETPSFSRFFKRSTGEAYSTFINKIRISHACSEIVKSDKSILEISLGCGFHNLSNFNRQFKLIVGMSPLKYKKIKQSSDTLFNAK